MDNKNRQRVVEYIRGIENDGSLSFRTTINVQIVVHNLWNTRDEIIDDERIMVLIRSLNNDFHANNSDVLSVPDEFRELVGSSVINFCLAKNHFQGDNNIGIIRKNTAVKQFNGDELFVDSLGGSTPWNQKKYLNIWIANIGNSISGFSTFPWEKDSINDGIVINTKYFGIKQGNMFTIGRVLVHEIGHYLGLIHIWGDGDDCIYDDGINDTPIQDSPNYGCPSYPQMGCKGSEMFMNFMDYTDDLCMFMFTRNQVYVMQNTIVNLRSHLNHDTDYCNLENIKERKLINYFPNPTNGIVKFEFSEMTPGLLIIEVFDILGNRIISNRTLVSDRYEVNISNLSPGLYTIRVNDEFIKVIKL